MSTLLEIPDLEIVRALPPGGRSWMYARITDHHDAFLEVNCESVETKDRIKHANIELRTRTCEGGHSLNTGNAISTIACQSKPEFPEIRIGETLWRPAERSNGIILLTRPTQSSTVLTIINAKQQCSAIISPEERVLGKHSIQVDDATFQRFLALGGAMQADWENVGDPVVQFKGKTLEQALESDRQFFFGSSSV